jgi:hypothetical protein
MIDLNVKSLVALTPVLQPMLKRAGAIINVVSTLPTGPVYGNVPRPRVCAIFGSALGGEPSVRNSGDGALSRSAETNFFGRARTEATGAFLKLRKRW